MQRNPLDLLLLDHLLEEMTDANEPADAPAKEQQQAEDGRAESLGVLPILPLRGVLVYPLSALPLRVSQPRSIRLIDDVTLRKMPVGLVASKHPEKDEPGPEDIFTVGTIATIARHFKAPDGVVNMIVQGAERFRIVEIVSEEPYIVAKVEPLPETWENSLEIEALRRNISEGFNKMAELRPDMPDELAQMIQSIEDPRQLTYAVATYMRMDLDDAQRLLEMDGLPNKMLFLLQLLNKELEVLQLGKKIQSEAQSEMEKVQREYFLREQIKAIQRELGEADEQQIEINAFREKIAASGMNEEARKEAERELDRMSKMPTQAAEYSVIRTYLDWMVSLPWQKTTQDNLDIAHARKVLDEDHYGLQDIKERILEFLAVRKRRQELQVAGSRLQEGEQPATDSQSANLQPETDLIRREREGVILCFVGPPGVGKTSLGASIARAMGRKFIRMSVGGIRDEAEIRGFRRTYIGSMPGRIIQSIRRAESRNPVFMLDEVDKMGSDFRGDPSSALLEVLDPEQNREFRDHYLDVPFDLSQTMFICTANTLETIPGPLRDRMEVLQLSGYTENEKLHIAQGYLVPRQLKENGLRPGEVTFSDEAILKLMREYTREAGVRNLEREIGSICRKLVARAQEGKVTLPFHVTPESLPDLRGKAKFYNEVVERTEIPGVATGLSWTPVGGEIIFIEATRMPGSKGFQLTGQLGDVMKESAQAALSYVRSHAGDLKIDPKIFDKSDIHVHVPAGAQPKDGPSAGVTIATALASLLTGRKVRHDVAMTGEITLRGSVLPVGGIKEKVLAAHRAGLKTIILPKRNEPDLDDLPPEVRDSLKFVLVDRVDQALEAALMPAKRSHERRNGKVQSKESRAKNQESRAKK
ncbi:MAG: endopeptidase La [Anaerolineae bacterium]|nr:endopeptidase La [Candidatus Roseilinea sp.]MDW8448674.1 endopeptidase La [Anaerolineae bacterium]